MASFYKTTRWKRKRKRILRRDHYLCRESARYGKTEPATTVHHCFSLEQFPELALVDWNLLSLCGEQHNAMHDRITGEITKVGQKWQERFKVQFIEFYNDKEVTNPNAVEKLKEYGVIK